MKHISPHLTGNDGCKATQQEDPVHEPNRWTRKTRGQKQQVQNFSRILLLRIPAIDAKHAEPIKNRPVKVPNKDVGKIHRCTSLNSLPEKCHSNLPGPAYGFIDRDQ